MLCYAWDRLKETEQIKVEQLEDKDIYNLLTRILLNNLSYLIKRGFYREYIGNNEELGTLKGKIDFNSSIERFSYKKGRMYCNFEELSHDILHNQIIKTTLYALIKCDEINEAYRERLFALIKYFADIKVINLREEHFKQARIHKNNLYYGFILDICKLIYDNMLISEETGKAQFKDFERDDRAMAYLFENFVRNFYRKECSEYKVSRENIYWDAEGISMEFLPMMQTDISLESNDRKIIMDTKYYKNALTNNLGSDKLISGNMYQLFSYLKNIEKKSSKDYNAMGILLYPRVNRDLNLRYHIHGHDMRIHTVDLNREWKHIHNRLKEIVS